MSMVPRWLLPTALAVLLASTSSAQPPSQPPGQPGASPAAAPGAKPPEEKKPPLEEHQSKTQHTIVLDGQKIAYTATAGTLVLKDEDGTQKASVFSVAYTKDGVKDPATRPVTFCFNGGPGSASLWVHLGAFGPKRVERDADGMGLKPPGRRHDIAARLARYTGLSQQYVERSNLRIEIDRFTKELLRDQGKTIGRLDTRFTGVDIDSVGEETEYDPASVSLDGPYEAMVNDYLRRDLGFKDDLPYERSARVYPWSFEGFENQYVNMAESLRRAVTRNPHLQVLITASFYDLATPYFDAVYTVDHLGLPEALRGNVRIATYEAGHMMYIRRSEHEKLKRDIAGVLRSATAP